MFFSFWLLTDYNNETKKDAGLKLSGDDVLKPKLSLRLTKKISTVDLTLLSFCQPASDLELLR